MILFYHIIQVLALPQYTDLGKRSLLLERREGGWIRRVFVDGDHARNARHQGASEVLANDGVERMRHGENVLVKSTMDERLEPKRMPTRENPCPQVGILGLWLSGQHCSSTPVTRAPVSIGRPATSTLVSLFARLTRLRDEPTAERRRHERVYVSVSWRRDSRSTAFP
jgi:hypothetical protein